MLNFTYFLISTTCNAYRLNRHLDTGFAHRVASQLKDVEGSEAADDVILPYMDVCLIT